LFIFLPRALSEAIPQESEQTISDFSLSGFGERGKRAWEITGKSADIFREQIKLDDFVGTIYEQEKISVTADRGDFNKTQNRVHLEDNVVILTESGARLTTDYLDWDRRVSQVSTEAPVDVKRDNITISGLGIEADTNLKNVDLKREVKLQINDKKNRIVITCTGPLSINYTESIAIFNKDVSVDDGQSQIYSDSMEVFFETSESDGSAGAFGGKSGKIREIIARGNVKIVREGNVSFSDQAVYNADDKNLILKGKPKLIIYSNEAQTYGTE
jgi:LPS export ABC transporter protein LptC